MTRLAARTVAFLIAATTPLAIYAQESDDKANASPPSWEEQSRGVISGSGGILASIPLNTPPSATAAEQPLDDSLASQTNKPPYDAAISQSSER